MTISEQAPLRMVSTLAAMGASPNVRRRNTLQRSNLWNHAHTQFLRCIGNPASIRSHPHSQCAFQKLGLNLYIWRSA